MGKELENNGGEDCDSIDDGGMGDASDNAESGKAGGALRGEWAQEYYIQKLPAASPYLGTDQEATRRSNHRNTRPRWKHQNTNRDQKTTNSTTRGRKNQQQHQRTNSTKTTASQDQEPRTGTIQDQT